MSCCCYGSPYLKYQEAYCEDDYINTAKYAKEIANLPLKEDK